jgi:hypothetical protein
VEAHLRGRFGTDEAERGEEGKDPSSGHASEVHGREEIVGDGQLMSAEKVERAMGRGRGSGAQQIKRDEAYGRKTVESRF